MRKFFSTLLLCISIPCFLIAQSNPILKVKSFKLDNGFTVFLNEDPTANQVFGAVMVNTGAKHESPDATGMAHYLEHLLFKGTTIYGTSDYEQEKPFLDSINVLYEKLAQTSDDQLRLQIQKAINEQAVKASKFGLPNEFDKMLKSIGSTGINAFTNYEMTFYHNSFPAHEMEKWLDLYAQRFQNPVFRSFQSELEVVYEEKNRASDDFERKIFREMDQLLFPNLPYGQWSVLGKTEHLKNPPINKMYEFFNKYYVANNMSLILVGNFKATDIEPIIRKKFSKLKAGELKKLVLETPTPITGRKKVKKRITPIKAGFLGYQTVGQNHPDRLALDICEYLLSNDNQTGYIDQIQLNGEMLYCGAFPSINNDAGGFTIFFVPKLFKSLGGAERQVKSGLEMIQTGKISDQQFLAAKNNLAKSFDESLARLISRGVMIGRAFNRGITWEEHLKYPEKIKAISKEEVQRVAKKYFGNDLVYMLSRTGFPKKDKLAKPPYKPITTDQNAESEYTKNFQKIPSAPFQPKFIDFTKDIKQTKLKGGHQIWAVKNPVNDIFYLTLRFKTGMLHQQDLASTSLFMNYAGTSDLSLNEVKAAFDALGCQYAFQRTHNNFILNLEGNEEQLTACLQLAGKLLQDPTLSEKAHKSLLNEVKTSRKVEKRTPSTLGRALFNYAVVGDKASDKLRLSERDFKNEEASKHLDLAKSIAQNYQADITFVGKTSTEKLASLLQQHLKLSESGKADKYIYLEGKPISKNQVLFVNDKKARQSQVYFYIQGEESPKEEYAQVQAFKQYFSGGFSGLVLQEIREYRSLAYSASANVSVSPLPNGKCRLFAYIGTQADKTPDAIEVMVGLLKDMPEKTERIPTLQKNLQLKVISSFPSFSAMPNYVRALTYRGYHEDPNKQAYSTYKQLNMADLVRFYKKHIQNKPMIITVYGDKRKIDMEKLKQFGEVKELKIEDVINF